MRRKIMFCLVFAMLIFEVRYGFSQTTKKESTGQVVTPTVIYGESGSTLNKAKVNSSNELSVTTDKTWVSTLVVDALTVSGTETKWSNSFQLSPKADYRSIDYISTSAVGTPNLKIENEVGRAAPATEGAADSGWAEPVSTADIVTALTSETIQPQSFSAVPFPYHRFKFTGNSGNATDTVTTIYLNELRGN